MLTVSCGDLLCGELECLPATHFIFLGTGKEYFDALYHISSIHMLKIIILEQSPIKVFVIKQYRVKEYIRA